MSITYSLEAVETLTGNETSVWLALNLPVGNQDLLAGTGVTLPAGNIQPEHTVNQPPAVQPQDQQPGEGGQPL